ncbi:WD repeat-containing protein 36 [Anthonomus grandis grandis]|uniref:WD repeat-containing protein 36 n=1 Tax=Anthonomus grandis grandis TaxID=2921223 RepID=UPI0021666CE3|nr:WD repeat-containing protein 36 [Anthonomus grandis grandis]
MSSGSKAFLPCRSLGYVSNHIPLRVRYIKSRKENLIVTCVGKSFHTYGISHFGLLSVSGLHPEEITCMTTDAYHVYTACSNVIYAWRRGTELKHTYKGHGHPIHLMIPFGVHLISVDDNCKVKIWDIKSETVYLELTFDKKFFNISALMHPSTYVNKVLFGSDKGQMQLWNLNKAKMVYSFKGWDAGISCIEQAPALDVVAVGLVNGRIVLHNLKFDETIMEFMQDWGLVTSISFRSDDHPIMATGSACGHIVFWDLEERRVSSQLASAHDGAVTGMVCLLNEPLILTSSPDNTLKLWIFDMPDGGARLLRIREGHSATPNHIRFHGANGHNILSAASDSTLRIFNTQTEQFNKSLGKASYNRKISKKRGRAVEDPLKMPPILKFTSETTRDKEWDSIAAIHSELSLVTTWSYDKKKMGELRLLPERFQKKNIKNGLEVEATCLCLTNCGNFVVVGYSTGHLDRFNIQSGHWRDSYGDPKAHDSSLRGVATDALNQVVISGANDGLVKFWRFKSKGSSCLTTLNLEEPISFFRSHRESSMLAVALDDFTVAIVDIDTRRMVRKFIGHTAQLTDATFSPDSRWLVTASMDCSIRTWNIPTGQLIDQFATEAAPVSIDMSPTGEALASAHVDYLGIFLWTNRTLYQKVTLKAISPEEEPPLVELPEVLQEPTKEEPPEPTQEEPEFISPEQISKDLATLSGLSTSRWQNLLNIDIIKQRNKPKAPPKAPKAAPFFLPTVSTLNNFEFDLKDALPTEEGHSKLLIPENFTNYTEFGKLLDKTRESGDFSECLEKLKSLGPSMIDFEIKSLAPEAGGSVTLILQFLRMIETILKSNKDFELAEAYLSVFLRSHGQFAAETEVLRNFLPNLSSCHLELWHRLQEKLMYSICVVQNLKTM